MIDSARRDPIASLAVLDGLTFGRIAPPVSERRKLAQPTLVIGHRKGPVHPFSDADTTAHDLRGARLVQARSIYEWRLAPGRLTGELCALLDEVWAAPTSARGA